MATDIQETNQDVYLEVTVPKTPERRRQGKFQPFRKLFGKRKKKGSEPGFKEAHLRASQSNGDVCNGLSSEDEGGDQRLRELNSRSLSHDSVFVPEEPRRDTGETMSQDNVSDKVRNLQRQIAQNIKFGPKPHPLRESEGSSDEEDTSTSPLQVQAQVEVEPALSQAGVQGGAGAPAAVKSPRPRRAPPATGTIESINLDAVPQSGPRLDNAAARHKLSVKPKNQRVSRKHHRITQDLQDMSHPGVLQEEPESQKQTETPSMPWVHDHQLDDKLPQESKKQKLQEEEVYRLTELQEQKQREEEQNREEEEKQREEAQRREEKKLREEEVRQREEEQKREEERQREEEKKRMEEEERQREEERKREEEKLKEEARKQEEIRQREEEKRRMEDERQREEQRKREEVKRQREQEEHLCLLEEKRKIEEQEERERLEAEKQREEDKRKQEEAEVEETKRKREAELQMEEEAEKKAKEVQRREEDPGAQQRRAEELRWREMEDRQRPFTFKVSSGEKQILFQKVNLTPVTPCSQQGGAPDSKETKVPPAGNAESPTLPASLYVPHTAILVTGAQLCGAAVDLNQIKDPACKSLLGLAEDKKAMTVQPIRDSGKTKSLKERSADHSSASVLAEWASIRSKIFRGVEGGAEGGVEGGREREVRPTSEDLSQKTVSHSNLRKTLSASAKFSITPARRKFPDANRPSEGMHLEERAGRHAETPPTSPSAPDFGPASAKAPPTAGKTVRIADGTEECVFAKDLPSFLVPSPPLGSPKTRALSECLNQADPEYTKGLGSEDKPSPFGIKLRRTNFSLRFHSEQPTEKRKKRYSAGDSFDGIPIPLTPADPDLDSSVFASPMSPLRDGSGKTSPAAGEPRRRVGGASIPALHSDSKKQQSRPPVIQKASITPRPPSATPPPSPLSRRTRGAEEDWEERQSTPQEPSRHEEVELKEKRSFFPSINIPWREKGDRRAELRREKPSLQSRHSLDSARAQEKESGPLWITLALQKQKGFRDQQLSREERRQMREVKLAEKQAKDRESSVLTSRPESQGSSAAPKLHPPQEGRPESLLARFERREHLRKSNTLPTSVTVEIADSSTSPPKEKDVVKRFPSSDSPPVSTEPAWLALAKRKAKAWSDCPQIIK